MWGNYPGQGQGQSQHQHHHQHHGGYGPPTGPPPGFPAPQGYSGGYGGYNPPPGPPPGGYSPSYAPPPGPPGGYGGNGYGHRSDSYISLGGPPPIPNYNPYPGGGTPHMPPSGVQNYGPHYQGTDNRDMQPYFQYSQCTGKRKALLIGINYIGHSQGQLKGCINDVHNVRRFLLNHGYKEDDMVILTDDSRHQRQMATKNNIIEAMQWLVRDAAPNDSLFFHYSGHGGQTKDLDGDEADGYDEVIYPVDYQDAGHIVDDDMHAIMVQPLPAGCRLTVIFDSCHSGSAIDLPYMYSTEGKIKEPNLAAEVGSGLFTLAKSYAQRDMSGLFQGAKSLFNVATGNTKKAEELTRRTKTSPADVISWAGCKDSQTSADTVEAGRATGAMSYAFISTLSQKPQQTYQELLVNIRAILSEKYSQKPQLSSSHPMDTSIVFIF